MNDGNHYTRNEFINALASKLEAREKRNRLECPEGETIRHGTFKEWAYCVYSYMEEGLYDHLVNNRALLVPGYIDVECTAAGITNRSSNLLPKETGSNGSEVIFEPPAWLIKLMMYSCGGSKVTALGHIHDFISVINEVATSTQGQPKHIYINDIGGFEYIEVDGHWKYMFIPDKEPSALL